MREFDASGARHWRTVRRAACAAMIPLAAWSFQPLAHAQDAASQDIAQARQLGQQAQAAYDSGNYAESERLWSAASKLYTQAPTLTLGLARTQAKLGKVVAAQESFNKIIREWGSNATAPQPFKDALEAAKNEVSAVSAKVASVILTVEGPPSPLVTIDGQTVPVAALGLKRPVDPGLHKVSATAEGFKPAEASFSVAEGGSAAATLKMERAVGASAASVAAVPAGAAAQPAASHAEPGADSATSGSSNKTLAFVAFGVGGAGLVVGAVTGLMALGKAGDLKDKCSADKACPASEQDNVDSYKSMGTLSTVGFVVAGLGGAAGAILLLTAPKTTSTTAARLDDRRKASAGHVTLSPYFGGTSAGVVGRF